MINTGRWGKNVGVNMGKVHRGTKLRLPRSGIGFAVVYLELPSAEDNPRLDSYV
jgi:hypothetical protein